MQGSGAKRRIAGTTPLPAIVVGARPASEAGARFSMLLTAFMRLVAAGWMIEGLLQWGAVLTPGPGGQGAWADLSDAAMVATIFFAVVNLVAAVGLWLAAPWGGIVWLVTAGAQLLVGLLLPGFFGHPVLIAVLDVGLVATYLALTWLATSVRGSPPPLPDRRVNARP